MIIKILLILGALGFGVLILRDSMPSHHQLLRRAIGLVVVFLGILAVLFPDSTNTVAHAVGVSRGADLLFYTSVMVFLYNAVSASQRMHRLEQQIAVLTRELAITRAEDPDPTDVERPEHPRS
ncbi:DUF2304 domain-containing protein [Nocardioides pocheonensis]|uniref:DUF2304 domain-containing protein n=1 Tax=Nocardioides pocheonensis TaxID=661485 RepID=A0A3N0GPP0_9ACTN|nr:DUF2304 domain-containing protein [Nocardioides pocheonensis]RNM14112.1 DUF2304 domain-containing protein [Nocardioides pocheonensis]